MELWIHGPNEEVADQADQEQAGHQVHCKLYASARATPRSMRKVET